MMGFVTDAGSDNTEIYVVAVKCQGLFTDILIRLGQFCRGKDGLSFICTSLISFYTPTLPRYFV